MKQLALRIAIAAALVAAATGPLVAHDGSHGDISKVNRSITIEDGGCAGHVDTVNGSVRVGENAQVETVETVNGSVRLGRGAHAESVETVNGGIDLAEDVTVARDVEAVNGSIELERGAEVVGELENVNGGIEVRGAHVGGRISTVSGDIRILEGARVDGGILIEEPKGWFNWNQNRPPRVIIGENAVVGGELRFEREVELHVHESAKIGTVSGATAKRYSGSAPF